MDENEFRNGGCKKIPMDVHRAQEIASATFLDFVKDDLDYAKLDGRLREFLEVAVNEAAISLYEKLK